LQILPTMVLAFVLAGMISVLLPRELMSLWLGKGSGLRGLPVGTSVGIMTPGGPFVPFPIIAALLKAGAGVAPIVAYITSWSLMGIHRFLVFEVPLPGRRLAVSRIAASSAFPIEIGLITRFIRVRLH